MRRSILALLAPGALVLVLVAGCVADPRASANRAGQNAGPPAGIARGLDWPPRLGERYPDLRLRDHAGRPVALSDFAGKVILLEPIGISCPACQAFAGANRPEIGPLRTCSPQANLQSIEEYLPQYAGGVTLGDPRLVYVQLLLYDWSAKAPPTVEEAAEWAAHFGALDATNRVVLVGDERLIGQASYDMIPGFQLIDRDFVLRVDSTGHTPRHNLWTELLPRLGELVREPARATAVSAGHRVGQRMPDFALQVEGGARRASLAELRGDGPAFVFFYSGCCGHCTDALPEVAEAARRYQQRGATVVGVEYLGNTDSCRRSRKKADLPGTLLADSDGRVCGTLQVGDLTVFLLDEQGIIRYRGTADRVPS